MAIYREDVFTYGAEHELGDWDTQRGLPQGFGVDRRDYTMVNSDGIAVDPKGKYHQFGGEINTPPTKDTAGQVKCLRKIKLMHPEATVNYRSNLHIHIGIPGLVDDLNTLKTIAAFNDHWLHLVLDLIEPIPDASDYGFIEGCEEYLGIKRRCKRMRVSHHTKLPSIRNTLQQQANTVEEFFEAEVPRSKSGKPLWHFQPRAAVNLRQLRETGTIEFRHFPGTLCEEELRTCLEWCKSYLTLALNSDMVHPGLTNPVKMYTTLFKDLKFPEFPTYKHWMEKRYRATTHDGSLKKSEIADNIRLIREGKFDEYTRGVSRQHKPVSSLR